MPSGLDAPALARWQHWCSVLLDLGVLSAECGPALESLVRAELRVRKARRDVAKHGTITEDGKERTAAARELDLAEVEFRRWCAEFGATPASRSRVRATKPSAPAKPTARDEAKKRFFGAAGGASGA
jgi:P27 family predicted phage terminase small subunit